jgi:hypothetical protein
LYRTNCRGYERKDTNHCIVDIESSDAAKGDTISASITNTTTRQLHVLSFSPIFMIDLLRFTITSERHEIDHNDHTIKADDFGTTHFDSAFSAPHFPAHVTSKLKPMEDSMSRIQIPDKLDTSPRPPNEELEPHAASVENGVYFSDNTTAAMSTTFASNSTLKHGDCKEDN